MSNRIRVAKITTAHGIKGFVKVKLYLENPKDIEQYNPLFTSQDKDQTLTLKLKNSIKTHWVAEIEGISDRNRAEELRGQELFIEESDLPEIEEGKFYHKDLIGMNILDNNQTIFGEVLSIQNYGAGDLLEIKPFKGATFFFPFNDDSCPTIDGDKKTIQTKDIESFIF